MTFIDDATHAGFYPNAEYDSQFEEAWQEINLRT